MILMEILDIVGSQEEICRNMQEFEEIYGHLEKFEEIMKDIEEQ